MPHVPRLQAHRHQRIQRCKRTPHVCAHTRPQVRQTAVGQDRRDGLGHCAVDRAFAWVSCHCVSLLHRPAVFQEEAHGVQPSRRCVSGNTLLVHRLSRSWTPNQPAFASHDNEQSYLSHSSWVKCRKRSLEKDRSLSWVEKCRKGMGGLGLEGEHVHDFEWIHGSPWVHGHDK